MKSPTYNLTISPECSFAIRVVRVFAMLCIIVCHLFQAYHCDLSWYINIGVQIFFTLSGFIYGHRVQDNWLRWYWKRFKKIYLPCLIYCLAAMTVLHFLVGNEVSVYDYLTISAIKGLDHLWFIKAILLCYLITPVLSFLRRYPVVVYFILIILFAIEFGFIRLYQDLFSWLWLYSMGYFFPSLQRKWKRTFMIVLLLAAGFSTILLLVRTNGQNLFLWHNLFGIGATIPAIAALSKINMPVRISRVIEVIDSYSFYAYITHHIYIIGPLSLTLIISEKICCVMSILVLTALSSFILKFVSDRIVGLLK